MGSVCVCVCGGGGGGGGGGLRWGAHFMNMGISGNSSFCMSSTPGNDY